MPPEAPSVDGRKLRYAGRRQELLDAVSAYIETHGVGELAMRPMAEAVGVSHATLLNHFGTKENLVTEVIDGFSKRSLAQGDAAGELTRDAHGRVDLAVTMDGYWRQFGQPEHLPAIRASVEVLGQAVLHPERYERFVEQFIGDWLVRLRRLVRACGCPPEENEAVTTMLLAQVRGFQSDLAATGDHERIDASYAVFVRSLVAVQAGWPPRD